MTDIKINFRNEKRLIEEFSGDLIKKITKVEEDILVKTDELFCKKEQFIDLYCIYNGLEKLVYKLLQKIKVIFCYIIFYTFYHACLIL